MSAVACDADAVFRVFTVAPGGTDVVTMILDVRKKETFRKLHVGQAFCVRLASSGHTLVDYSNAQYSNMKWAQDCWWGKRVIVYGDSSLRKDHPVLEFLSKQGKCHSLHFYKEGFEDLQKKKPFLCTASVKDQTSMRYPSQIVPGLLYLGDWSHAEAHARLDEIGVKSIITIHNHPENLKPPSRFKHARFELPDVETADISIHFNRAFETIEEAAQKGYAVLVHCGAGVSRSATLCMMYLMRRNLWTAARAKQLCVERRSLVCPNDGFWRALCALESSIGVIDRSDPNATSGFRGDDAPLVQLSDDAAGDKVAVRMLSLAALKRQKAEGGASASEDAPAAKRQKGQDTTSTSAAAAAAASGDAKPPKPGSYVVTLAVSKPEGLVGNMEVGPMHYSQRCVFGRAPGCNVVLEHLSISRHHAQLTVDAAGMVYVTDMQSGHGTKLDDTWIRPQVARQLRVGSVMHFGASSRAYKVLHVVPAL